MNIKIFVFFLMCEPLSNAFEHGNNLCINLILCSNIGATLI